MKNLIKTFILGLSAACAMIACEPSDANKDYGFPVIYIPQATVTGLDNSYPIPQGPMDQNTSYCCKFDSSTGKLDIVLGVVRAGYISNSKAFSVNLSECQEQTDRKLSEYASKGTAAMQLPSSCYSAPEKISVEKGKNGGTCYLAVDLKSLSQQSSTIVAGSSYKLLVLGLQISNPSAYELAESNTSVVVVLDLNSSYWGDDVRALFPTI